jgi:hypothetical protein
MEFDQKQYQTNKQDQYQTQDQQQEIHNSGNSSSNSNNNGNTQVTEFNSPSDLKIRNVVSPGTPNSYPTSPCRIARSGGLSFPGGALSGGGSIEDVECTLRETARSFKDLGVPEMGLYILCQNSTVVNGRRNKKGELDRGENPVGADECFRLVREFQGATDDTSKQYRQELETIRHDQKLLEEELYRYRTECKKTADRSFSACQQTK